MKATRATTTAVFDGATIGTVTETPPEDPPPERKRDETPIPFWLVHLILHIVMQIIIHG